MTRPKEVRFFSYPEFKEIGRVKHEKHCYYQNKFGTAYTLDSRSLWVACLRRGSKDYDPKTYTAAIKISIPELKVVKHFMAPHPREGADFLSGYGHISVLDNKIILTGSLATERSKVPYVQANDDISFLYSYDLEARHPFYTAYRYREDINDGTASGGVYSPTNSILAMRNYASSWQMLNGRKSLVTTKVDQSRHSRTKSIAS